MKLNKLEIKKFRNLEDFSIIFSEHPIHVLLGRNASAKSNLIEAIVTIFKELDLGEIPSFQYKLLFECKSKTVLIDAGFSESSSFLISVGDRTFTYEEYISGFSDEEVLELEFDNDEVSESETITLSLRDEVGDFLPNHVFAYYSGLNKRLRALFLEAEERYLSSLLQNENRQLRRLFFTDGSHSDEILFAFLCDQTLWSKEFLQKTINLREVVFARLDINTPDQFEIQESADMPETESGPRFWHTGGNIYAALQAFDHVGVPLRQYGLTDSPGTLEKLFIFFRGQEKLRQLRFGLETNKPRYTRAKDLFQALDDLRISGFLDRIRFGLKLAKSEDIVDVDGLSEGEKQLLTVIGLLRFTRDQDSLFLLDEPDTHLNPQWSYRYRKYLEQSMEGESSCQIIFASHDPIVIAGMEKDQVHILSRSDDLSPIRAHHPEENPQGMGIGKILTSPMFGLRSLLDEDVLFELDEKRELSIKPERTEVETNRLKELNKKLRHIDLTTVVDDPLYPLFVDAIMRHPDYAHLKKIFLSESEFERQDAMADEVREQFIAYIERTQDETH